MLTVKGRIEKPLLSARPVRAIPKSTPREKKPPPLHCGSLFLRSAFGGSSSKDSVAFTKDEFFVTFEGGQQRKSLWGVVTGGGSSSSCCVHIGKREKMFTGYTSEPNLYFLGV